jgi:thiol-disulfide isomerase/thioredoxin
MSRADFHVPYWFKIVFVWASIVTTLALVVYQFEKRASYWQRHVANAMQPLETASIPALSADLVSLFEARSIDRSEPTLYHFWATWCAPCRTEIPTLNALQKHFEGQLKVITISADENKDDVLKFFSNSSPQFVVLWDKSQKVSDQWGVQKYPESFLVSRDGRVLRFAGARDWSSPEAIEYLTRLL